MKHRAIAGVVFLLLTGLILGVKAVQLSWLLPKPPLALNGQPAILFFNKDRGCECELFVYRHAELQISAWPQEKRAGIPIIPVNIEHRPDLVKKYQVIRAPALILLDSEGQILWRQDEALNDRTPFNLQALQNQVEKIVWLE